MHARVAVITSVFVFFTLPLIGLGQHQGHQMPPIRSPTPATSPSPSVEEHDMDSMLMGPLVIMTRDSMGTSVHIAQRRLQQLYNKSN
jgi:hypothetical protein